MSTKIRYSDDTKLIQDKSETAVFLEVITCSLADGYAYLQCY